MEPNRPYPIVSAVGLKPDGNIFNMMRLILASAVIWSQIYALLGTHDLDPSLDILLFPISRLAVLLFFPVRGFLVVPGLMHAVCGSVDESLRKRALCGCCQVYGSCLSSPD